MRPARLGERGQVIVAARVEQAVLGQGARRDDAHHVAPDHRLGAALLGLGRILDLLADRDLEALADQLGEIALGGVHRHAAHRDVVALMLAALGQRDVERRRGLRRILEEQLVEIAHAVEQQIVGMGRLDREILRHHRRWRRRGDRRRFRHRRRSIQPEVRSRSCESRPYAETATTDLRSLHACCNCRLPVRYSCRANSCKP